MPSAASHEHGEFSEFQVRRAWSCLCERLNDPVRVTTDRHGFRVVEVLGVLRYLMLHSARRVHFAYAAGRGRFITGPMRACVAVDPVLAGNAWLSHFIADWLITRGAKVAPEDVPDFARRIGKTSAFRLLLERVRACRVEGPLRDRTASALALEPRVIWWACQGLPGGELSSLDSLQYSAVWRRREALEQLEREQPSLLRPYAAALLGDVLGEHPEPARNLKLAFRDFGIRDAGWKLLLDAPAGHFDPIIASARNEDLFEVYLWALHACLLAGRLLPRRVLYRLVMPNGREPGRPTMLDPSFPEGYWAPFLRALGRRINDVADGVAMREFLDGEFEEVYDWLEWECPVIDSNQARAGWTWMVRQHREWQEREREKALACRAEMRWDVPVSTSRHGPWRVVALRDSYELWEEGHLMRHCVRTYAERCRNGSEIVASIRNERGERVATGHLISRCSQWEVWSVRTLANRPAGSQMWAVAKAFARACQVAASRDKASDRQAA